MLNYFSSKSKILSESDGTIWDHNKISFHKELIKSVLVKKKLNTSDIIILVSNQRAIFFSSLLAIWELGFCAACISPSTTRSELKNIIKKTKAKIIIDYETKNIFYRELKIDSIDTKNLKNIEIKNITLNHVNFDNNALIIFTSGTTNQPKGAVHTFRSIYTRINLNKYHIGEFSLKNTLCPLPTHFGHGLIGNCLTSLYSGTTLHLLDKFSTAHALRFNEIIDELKITFLCSVPTMWKLILKVSKKPKQKNVRIHIGSSSLSNHLMRQVAKWSNSKNIYNMYGITETCNWIGGKKFFLKNKNGEVGRPWGGKYAILTSNNIIFKGKGEILINTPSIMKGYFKSSTETRKSFYNSWFKTGDYGELKQNGELTITGRIKNEINKSGLKIYPEDIDLLLEKHPLVIESYTFGLEDEITGEVACTAIQISNDSKTNRNLIVKFCEDNFLLEKQPDKWFWLDKIPKNERGKVIKKDVIELCSRLNGY